jgi:RNA polymerase sigma-70 factor, ECF subfamily
VGPLARNGPSAGPQSVAFLVTVTTRVALNAATSSRARREVSVAGRLSERDFTSADPAIEAERSEELELAVQLLIERLPPVKRAVYVLREAFDYPFRDIAEALDLSASNARQLAHRARRHLAEQGTTRSNRRTRLLPPRLERRRRKVLVGSVR